MAGFPFFLILGKDNVLRGFHNVCRHRAYTVTKKSIGSSLVLGCRYHCWSYDTKGLLTKAPQFDDIPGFRKEDNSLFQIWVKPDANGFVFVSFNASWDVEAPPTEPCRSFAVQNDVKPTPKTVASWEVEADINWKSAGKSLTDIEQLCFL